MKKKNVILYTCLILLILLLSFLSLRIGSTQISANEIWETILHWDTDSVNGTILLNIRFPRMLAAAFLGGALALSGYLLQAFFHNPIAGPFVLGISSGAKLIVAILMVASASAGFGISSMMMVGAAVIGSLIATVFVILAAGKVRSMSILIVCGVMIGYISSAITELLVAFADDSNIVNLHNWSQGSFSGTSWQNVWIFVPVILLGTAAAILMAKGVEAYLYGERYAISVGVNVRRFRILLILISSILSAAVTAFAGPVSFVGIAVPHVVRKIFKSEKPRTVMVGSFLGGAAFSLFSDLIARSLFAPTELSISTITAVFGAPIVISMLLSKKNKKESGR